MSSHWIIRLSVYTVICAVFLAHGLAESTYAQKSRVLQGPPGAGDGAGDNARQGRPGDRGLGRSNQATTTTRPKFINLLESKDLSQFRGYAQEEIGEGWSLDGKYLYFDGSGGGDVITKEVYDDFDLQVEWRVADGANSGIMYRVSLGDDAPYFSGPEYQILDDAEHQDGENELTAAGSLYGMFPAKEKTLRKVGSWNKTRIIVEGNKVIHYLNSKKVLEIEIGSDEWNKQLGESKFKDWAKYGKNKEGHIAFQDHGNEVWFRNVRIKRLASSQMADKNASSKDPKTAGRPRRGGSKFEQMENSLDLGGDDGGLDK